MQKVFLFLDYANINRGAIDLSVDLDYSDLTEYLGEGRTIVDSLCYVPIDPRKPTAQDATIEYFQKIGYLVTSKTGVIRQETYKCNFDVEMTMDITSIAHSVRPDIVVLATGDGDFLPVVKELRKMGIRVEVAAFEHHIANQLLLNSSGFINLNVYLEDKEKVFLPEEVTQEDTIDLEQLNK